MSELTFIRTPYRPPRPRTSSSSRVSPVGTRPAAPGTSPSTSARRRRVAGDGRRRRRSSRIRARARTPDRGAGHGPRRARQAAPRDDAREHVAHDRGRGRPARRVARVAAGTIWAESSGRRPARADRTPRLRPRRRRRRLLARRRDRLAGTEARPVLVQRPLGRGRDRRRRRRPRRPRDEPRPLLGAPGRRRQLRHRHRGRDRALPGGRGLRRVARLADRPAAEVLGAWAAWTKDAPEEVMSVGRLLQIPPIPEMPEPLRGRQVVVVEAAFLGAEAEGRELLRPLRELGPELDTVAMMPAAGTDAAPPGSAGARAGPRRGLDARRVRRLRSGGPRGCGGNGRDGAADLDRGQAPRGRARAARPERGRPVAPRGAVCRVLGRDGAEPGGGRRGRRADRRHPARGRAVASRSTYFNFAERDADASTLYPGGQYERLVEIRAEVDPDGVFRAKHPID